MVNAKFGASGVLSGDDGARIKVAELGLAVGEQLKYVYDFGDWIEHQLNLQAIEAPQSSVKYPREFARNQPKYAFCVECQKKGKQQVAKWICLECRTGPEQEILLCEKSADKHDDHYLETEFHVNIKLSSCFSTGEVFWKDIPPEYRLKI